MDWKLKRGKWRPNLLKYIQELPAGSAEDATRAAFSVLSKHRGGGGPQGKAGGGQGAAAAPQPPPAEVVKQALAAVTVLKVGGDGVGGSAQAGSSAAWAAWRVGRERLSSLAWVGTDWACLAAPHFCPPGPRTTQHTPMLAPQGIGPATGSAILEASDPSIAFTSDEAMDAALNSKEYTGGLGWTGLGWARRGGAGLGWAGLGWAPGQKNFTIQWLWPC